MRIPTILTLFLLFLFTRNGVKNPPKEAATLLAVVNCMKNNHFQCRDFNDALAADIFNAYLEALDPEKCVFTCVEIEQLNEHRLLIDNEIQEGRIDFFNKIIKIRIKALENAAAIVRSILNEEIHTASTDADDINFYEFGCGNEELRNRWRHKIKQQYLEGILTETQRNRAASIEIQRSNAKKRAIKKISNQIDALKAESRMLLFSKYINAYLKANDIQTEYLTDDEKKQWEAEFSRNLVGIGVELEMEAGYPKIKRIIPNGPAEQAGLLSKEDLILQISDVAGNFVDVGDKTMHEVINLLKGEPKSTVKLMVKKKDQPAIPVTLTRDHYELEKLHSFLLSEGANPSKIAYLKLFRFYEGCSADLLHELTQFNKMGIKSLILDLRDNQGGSAIEARKIMGYFLEGGVVMYAKYKNNQLRIFEDESVEADFTGKLVIAVNENSSSASELTAGTLQDYGRAVIVGSQTYGKGTIQRFHPIQNDTLDLGEIKLTIGVFYTANGRSVQYQGVLPDIRLPAENSLFETGERAYPNALKVKDHSCPLVPKSALGYINLEEKKRRTAPGAVDITGFHIEEIPEDKTNYWRNSLKSDSLVYECFKIVL